MDEDLLVLLVPGVERIPFEADSAGQTLSCVLGIQPGRTRASDLASAKSVQPGDSAMQALRMLLIYKQLALHVSDRDVVLRVVGPFPDVQRAGGVEHRSSAEGGTDPAGYRLN